MAAGRTYTPIATTTLGSATNTLTFNSIPSTYTDLVIICNYSQNGDMLQGRFNSDTSTNSSTSSSASTATTSTSPAPSSSTSSSTSSTSAS